jgi:hypothetical protein
LNESRTLYRKRIISHEGTKTRRFEEQGWRSKVGKILGIWFWSLDLTLGLLLSMTEIKLRAFVASCEFIERESFLRFDWVLCLVADGCFSLVGMERGW